MRRAGGELFLAGERVLTGTILCIRKSRKGTVTVEMGIEKVMGYASKEVASQFWMKRSKLKKGMAWQNSVILEIEEQQRKKRQSRRFRRKRGVDGRQFGKALHGPPRCFSPEEIAAWAERHGYGVSSSVEARLAIP